MERTTTLEGGVEFKRRPAFDVGGDTYPGRVDEISPLYTLLDTNRRNYGGDNTEYRTLIGKEIAELNNERSAGNVPDATGWSPM